MNPHEVVIMLGAACSVSAYGMRLSGISWQTHPQKCVSAQLIGALTSCLLIYGTAGGWDLRLMYLGLLLVLGHYVSTRSTWDSAAAPQQTDAETSPMPIDGAHQ